MQITNLFIALTFIVIIAVIILAESVFTAVMIISIMFNLLVLVQYGDNPSINITPVEKKTVRKDMSSQQSAPQQTPSYVSDYGPLYDQWQAYRTSYDNAYCPIYPNVKQSCAERDSSVDAAGALMSQRRARDKKCSDGWATKDANYFKYHYGDELEEAESKRWWGNFEQ